MAEYSKYVLAALLLLAGIAHLLKPQMYMKIMPGYLPAPRALVFWSGVAEVVCAVLLVVPVTQKLGAWSTVALLVAVFPANIEMTRKYYVRKKTGLGLTVIRLPLQIALIWWVLQFT